jgi:hypothetical protein
MGLPRYQSYFLGSTSERIDSTRAIPHVAYIGALSRRKTSVHISSAAGVTYVICFGFVFARGDAPQDGAGNKWK